MRLKYDFKETFMKHFMKILFLFLYISLLSGCLGIAPTANEIEPAKIVPSSTIALTSILVTTPMQRLPTATPTFTATATPPSIPTLVSNRNSSVYQLTKPSPADFLGLIDTINTQHSYFNSHYGYEDNAEFDFMLNELSNLRDVIDAEIKFYYPNGFPNPEIVWNYYPPTNDEWFFYFPSVFLNILTDAVFNDLNRNYHDLKDEGAIEGNGYVIRSYPVELDHDSQPEWLVRIDWEKITALSWVVLDQNLEQGYTRLKLSPPSNLWLPTTWEERIEVLQDFTGDVLTDIILVNQGYAMGTDFYSFYIAKGTKDGFQELRSISKTLSVTVSTGSDYKIETPPGSHWLNLALSDPHNINWGCTWDTQTSYRWPNGIEQITITGKEMPQTPECSLAQAVKLYEPVDNSTAIRLLENAVAHFDNSDINQYGKSLFAHYRLAILYALEDQDSRSRQHLQWLVENISESNSFLTKNITSILGTPKINAISLCDMIYAASESEIPKSWENYIDATAALHAYPYSNEIYRPAICPLREILADNLEKVNLTVQPISEKALTDQGIPVVAVQTYPFPDQERPASFMLVGVKTLYVLGYVPTLEGWEWRLLDTFDAGNGLPQAFFQDVTNDGFPELAYFQEYRYWYCPENEQGYKIFLTTSSGLGFVSLTYYVCSPVGETFDIASYLPDDNKDGVVDWVTEQIRESAGDSFLSAERIEPVTWFTPDEIRSFLPEENNTVDNKPDIISELYTGNNLSITRQKLMAERDGLNPYDLFADREWQRLTYLIAVSFEIEGQADKAVEAFTSVLQSENQTLWGNLAELHLMGK